MNENDLEQTADLLKERIYASLALLAVLLSIDDSHTSVLSAAFAVGGTALSLWAASLISTMMARRIVHKRANTHGEFRHQLQKHSPLLASAIFPLFMIGLAATHLIDLHAAITVALISLIISLVAWSLASARAMGAAKLGMLWLGAIEALIGLAIVALKVFVSH